MDQTGEKIADLSKRLAKFKESVDLSEKRKKIEILESESASKDFWKDAEKARSSMQLLSNLKKELTEIEELTRTISTLEEFSQDQSLGSEIEKEVRAAEKTLEKLELISFLSGPYDPKGAILSVHAGQGGVEAMDWASMLFRMYMRFCERRGWKTEVLDVTEGEEAGIKSITFRVSGPYAYGYLKGEAGTHRLVRQSPFNADKLRQTSFALVEVLPEFEDVDIPDIDVKEEDLDWQFFRSSSQGGQNVQKVSTAVRLTHKPTGIVVSAQAQRFQEQNRKIALSILKSKLWKLREEMVRSEKKALKGGKTKASWGTQIRSYVLHPYKMVKDLRTETETSNVEAVLNGEIDEFVESQLKLVV